MKNITEFIDIVAKTCNVTVSEIDSLKRKIGVFCNFCSYKWNIYTNSKRSFNCPNCRKEKRLKDKFQSIKELIVSKGGICISDEYVGNNFHLWVECGKKHKWKITSKNLKKGHWCPFCAKVVRLSIKNMQKIAEKNRGKCISKIYRNAHQKLKWECDLGHRWKQKYNNIQQGNWCPVCHKTSKNQRFIFEFCKKYFKDVRYNYRGFDWLKNKTNSQEIDIFVDDIKLAIEYDGPQHFSAKSIFGGEKTFKRTKFLDDLKNKKIHEHSKDVNFFIRIPYWQKLTEEKLKEILKQNGIYLEDKNVLDQRNELFR